MARPPRPTPLAEERALARRVISPYAMRAPTAAQLRLELFRLQCTWRRAQHAAELTGERLPPFPREQIERIAAQLPRPQPTTGELSDAVPGEVREYVDSAFRAEPTGTSGATDLGGRACSAWVHCHHAEPALSAMRCELRTTVALPALEDASAVTLRSCVRSQFAWVEATSSATGLAALRADAWLEVALANDGRATAVSAPFYDHVATGRQLYFPSRKTWTTELEASIEVPAGAGHVLIVTEAIELFASAHDGSNTYVSGRFAWEPLRAVTRGRGRWDQVTLPPR